MAEVDGFEGGEVLSHPSKSPCHPFSISLHKLTLSNAKCGVTGKRGVGCNWTLQGIRQG